MYRVYYTDSTAGFGMESMTTARKGPVSEDTALALVGLLAHDEDPRTVYFAVEV